MMSFAFKMMDVALKVRKMEGTTVTHQPTPPIRSTATATGNLSGLSVRTDLTIDLKWV